MKYLKSFLKLDLFSQTCILIVISSLLYSVDLVVKHEFNSYSEFAKGIIVAPFYMIGSYFSSDKSETIESYCASKYLSYGYDRIDKIDYYDCVHNRAY